MNNKNINLLIVLALSFCFIISACSKVPVTNRRQVNLLPESTLISMSLDTYNGYLKENTIIKKGKEYEQIQRTGSRISKAVEAYLSGKAAKRVKNFQWEFNLLKDDKNVNAFALPGGKVIFLSGIMPICQTEMGVAVVMSHEIAHAIARHGNERVSSGLAVNLGGIGLAAALGTKATETQNIFNQAYGITSSLGMLKFSRKHESEADKMGLVFMAMAGYDPNEAVDFWSRMKTTGGDAPAEFLSTHPSHDTRIKDLQEFMPEAMKYYKGPNKVNTSGKKVNKGKTKVVKPNSNNSSGTTTPSSGKVKTSKPKSNSDKPKVLKPKKGN